MTHTGAIVLLLALVVLVTVVMVRGIKRRRSILKTLNESFLGLVGIFLLLPVAVPRTRRLATAGEIMLLVVLALEIWNRTRQRPRG
jgi:ABC-type transport system involved in cytochrome c biogenesis permease subunit